PAHPAHRPTVSREGSGAALLAGHVRRALIADAHEIHFLPAADEIRVYHRIGSALVYAGSGPVSLTYLLLARLETLGGPAYDAEQPHARGRAVCPLGDHEALLDVSLLRIETGLAIVLGVRSAGGATPALEDLGIDPVDLACVRGVLDQPAGLVLVSGPSRSGCSTTLASMLGAVPTDARRSVAFEPVTGTPLPSPTRLSLGAELVRAAWREIVVGQCADVVAIDDAFTGEHVADLLGTDFSGRLVLATTDWSDSLALIDFLGSRPGGSQILADRLRLFVQQRMACFEPDPGEPEAHTAIFDNLQDDQTKLFEEYRDVDFAFEIPGLSRFRANIMMQNRGEAAVFRLVPNKIRTLEELGMPGVLKTLAEKERGLVVVTGPTGSGKSTTLAAMIDYVNETVRGHIITVEDPIEFVHESKRCLVNQREVGPHTRSFAAALRASLREDPDVILVGELRDLETTQLAISAAETGHLVFATLHTNSAAKTIDRIIDIFPSGQQAQIRTMLSESIEGIVAQTLLPAKDGKGRVAALEVLVGVPALRNLIREDKTAQILSVIQTGAQHGMISLDQHLRELVMQG